MPIMRGIASRGYIRTPRMVTQLRTILVRQLQPAPPSVPIVQANDDPALKLAIYGPA